MSLRLVPSDRDHANAFIARYHRHSDVRDGYKFAVAVEDGAGLRGVAISGRPNSRALQDGFTIEILRVCTDGARNACSILYGASCRAAQNLGYRLAITYTLSSESGASLRAAGFAPVAEVKDRQWDCDSRPRAERDLVGDKIRWERVLVQKTRPKPGSAAQEPGYSLVLSEAAA
jgi:hypothetical protein